MGVGRTRLRAAAAAADAGVRLMALCLLVMLLVSHEDLINVALGFLLSVFAWVFDPFQLGIGGFVLGGGACLLHLRV